MVPVRFTSEFPMIPNLERGKNPLDARYLESTIHMETQRFIPRGLTKLGPAITAEPNFIRDRMPPSPRARERKGLSQLSPHPVMNRRHDGLGQFHGHAGQLGETLGHIPQALAGEITL